MLSINCNSRTTSEVLLVDVATSHFKPLLVQPRQLDLRYHVEHWRGRLIILASTGPGQEYQVMSTHGPDYVHAGYGFSSVQSVICVFVNIFDQRSSIVRVSVC